MASVGVPRLDVCQEINSICKRQQPEDRKLGLFNSSSKSNPRTAPESAKRCKRPGVSVVPDENGWRPSRLPHQRRRPFLSHRGPPQALGDPDLRLGAGYPGRCGLDGFVTSARILYGRNGVVMIQMGYTAY
jgi:hypothetical protein